MTDDKLFVQIAEVPVSFVSKSHSPYTKECNFGQCVPDPTAVPSVPWNIHQGRGGIKLGSSARKITRNGHKFLAKSKKWIRVEPSSQEITGRGALSLTRVIMHLIPKFFSKRFPGVRISTAGDAVIQYCQDCMGQYFEYGYATCVWGINQSYGLLIIFLISIQAWSWRIILPYGLDR